MRKSRFSEEQMVRILRETDASAVIDVAKQHGVSEQTLYSCRKWLGGLETADAQSVLQSIGAWFGDYNEHHPHKALKWRSLREFRRQQRSLVPCPGI